MKSPFQSRRRFPYWVCCCLVFCLFHFGRNPAQGQVPPPIQLEGKNVLVLHAFESNVPIFELTDAGIRAALDKGGVGIRKQFFEYLDLARNPGPAHRAHLAELMRLRYGDRRIDIIITLYPEALQFALDEGRTLFSETPIVALYLPLGFKPQTTKPRIIRQTIALDMVGTLESALALVPGARTVYVVSGAHAVDRKYEEKARHEFKQWDGQLAFRYLSDLPLHEILHRVSAVPPGNIVLLLGFAADVTGENHTTRGVGERLSRVSKAPVFGLLQIGLGYGIAGGRLVNFEVVGAKAGELAVDILNGTRAPDVIPPILTVPSVPMFDWQQLRRWKLREGDLPEGSIVINREKRFWDFRYHILGGLALMLIQSLLIAGLLVSRRHKRSAEESLRAKTEELDQFFSVSLELLCIATTNGRFLRLNPAWERVLGYSREELTGRRFFDFVHPDDLVGTREAVAKLSSQREVTRFENRYRCRDGTYRWLEWTSAPAGDLIYATARDLTMRMEAEAEARMRRDELAHMARIAAMGELTSSLAHEINQPLAAIRSNAEAGCRFLEAVPPDIDEVRQILDDIIRDDTRAADVVQNVKKLVRKEKPRLESLDLNQVVQEVMGLIRGDSLLRGLSISMEPGPDVNTIHGSRVQLQQVILNLILNSAAAMRDSPLAQRRIIVRTSMEDSGTVKVSVRDFGTGIDENAIEQMLAPFYTTKTDGLGMGLSISNRIIRDHGGTLEAANHPEGGALFWFTLPVYQGDPT
jgi:PAS domain S-box-containing protein